MKKVICALMAAIISTGCMGGLTKVNGVDTLSYDKSAEQIAAYAKRAGYRDMFEDVPDTSSDYSSPTLTSLPDISTVPVAVQGSGQINITVLTATERATPPENASQSKDDWINLVGERFNREQYKINGKTVSVTIYACASGLAMDLIAAGRASDGFTPVGYNPSTMLWIDMLKAKGIEIEVIAEATAGNTVGIVMHPEEASRFKTQYGDVTIKNVITAVTAGDLQLSMTDPFRSSTGITALQEIMYQINPADPFGDGAVAELERFLSYVPPVAVTTGQLRNILNLGVINAAFMEYQSFAQSPQLSQWEFYPFSRHDGPMAVLGSATEEERQALEFYTEYLKGSEAQKEASARYFNALNDFEGNPARMNGEQLMLAQATWKRKKDALVPTVFFFVFDTSGSMRDTIEGRSKLSVLVDAVLNNLNYINENNYIGMISYSDGVYLNLPIVQATPRNKAVMAYAVRNLEADGGTATHDAVFVACDQILKFQQTASSTKPVVLLLSDGEQNQGVSLEDTLPSIYGIGIPIQAIGYHIEEGGKVKLQKLVGIYGDGFEGMGSYTSASEYELDMKLRDLFNSQG
ncbi:MAG: VWA domain-containing protein [Clostridiales bacterium]|jgi:Ca-activated chloride channel family protein|nr:VWA domain-containing protein [Clostridiales bacterium]